MACRAVGGGEGGDRLAKLVAKDRGGVCARDRWGEGVGHDT